MDYTTVLMILFIVFLLIAVVSVKLDTRYIKKVGDSLAKDLSAFMEKEGKK